MPMSLESLYEVRRENLRRLVLDRFDGKRSAFARAANVHQNHVNLILSTNPEHRRNMGEPLSRRIEEALKLPSGWFNNPGSASTLTDGMEPISIGTRNLPPEIGNVLKQADIPALVVTQGWINSLAGITSVDNLFLACLANESANGDLRAGCRLVVDGGVQAVTVTGWYVLRNSKTEFFLRHLTRGVSGGWIARGATASEALDDKAMRSIKAVGRVVARVPEPVVI